jgi:hypothetical protein
MYRGFMAVLDRGESERKVEREDTLQRTETGSENGFNRA